MFGKSQGPKPVRKETWNFKKHEGSPPPPASVKYIAKSLNAHKLGTIAEEPNKWFAVK